MPRPSINCRLRKMYGECVPTTVAREADGLGAAYEHGIVRSSHSARLKREWKAVGGGAGAVAFKNAAAGFGAISKGWSGDGQAQV